MNTRKRLGIIAAIVITVTPMFVGGCATKSGSAQQDNMADWEWVPSVWVNDSFAGGKYRNCSYDDYTNGYLCPPGTK